MTDTTTTKPEGRSFERPVLRVRINVGARVSQDRGFGRWPATRSGEEVDPDMEFDADFDGRFWDCRADGFGRRSWLGEKGGYGNGSITVLQKDGVTIVEQLQNTTNDRPPVRSI